MSLSISEIIILKSPSLSGDSRLTGMIELAEQLTSKTSFGDKYNHAVALLVLHWLTLDAQSGGSSTSSGSGIGGGVKSEKEGELSRSFGIPSSASDKSIFFNSTSFGMELMYLWRSCLVLPTTRRVGAFIVR